MSAVISFEGWFEIPMNLRNLADFRQWALSDGYPDRGRVDYVRERIEVDVSPKDLFTHGTPKTEIVRVLSTHIKQGQLGHLLVDSTRVSSPSGDLSAEPDIVFVSRQSLASGNARWVPKASADPDRYVEVEGAPDLVVEIVSDSSARKDTQILPAAYFAAGVAELWLVDVRTDEIRFQIHRRGLDRFEPAESTGGIQQSMVLGCGFRLDRHRDVDGYWEYDLQQRRID